MASINEIPRVRAWLVSVLAGAAAGGVYAGIAPANTPTPYIIIGHQAGQDESVVGAIRYATDGTWQVKAVGPASDLAAVEAAADAIDNALQRASGTTPGANILFAVRTGPLEQPEEHPDGSIWINLGGLYTIIAQAA